MTLTMNYNLVPSLGTTYNEILSELIDIRESVKVAFATSESSSDLDERAQLILSDERGRSLTDAQYDSLGSFCARILNRDFQTY